MWDGLWGSYCMDGENLIAFRLMVHDIPLCLIWGSFYLLTLALQDLNVGFHAYVYLLIPLGGERTKLHDAYN